LSLALYLQSLFISPFSRHSFCLKMRFFAVVGAVCAAAVAAEPEPSGKWAGIIPASYQPDIAVVEPNKTYTVRLECAGCPHAVIQGAGIDGVIWEQPPQDNALQLDFDIKTLEGHSKPSLLLNGRSILPLEPMPLYLNAWQVPANTTATDMTMFWIDPAHLTVSRSRCSTSTRYCVQKKRASCGSSSMSLVYL